MSRIIDLTHVWEEGMSAFPGDPKPRFDVVDYGVSRIMAFSMTTHTGTHIDCSAHLGGKGSTDTLPPAFFVGKGLVVDCSAWQDGIPVEAFTAHDIAAIEFLLLHCGFSAQWNTPEFTGKYPVLTEAAMNYLTAFPGLRGIGVEYLSIDPVDSPDLPLHKLWLCGEKERCIIENLTNLELLIGIPFTFMALPLKIKNGEASPVRAIAILE